EQPLALGRRRPCQPDDSVVVARGLVVVPRALGLLLGLHPLAAQLGVVIAERQVPAGQVVVVPHRPPLVSLRSSLIGAFGRVGDYAAWAQVALLLFQIARNPSVSSSAAPGSGTGRSPHHPESGGPSSATSPAAAASHHAQGSLNGVRLGSGPLTLVSHAKT